MNRRKLVGELKRKLDEVKQCNDDDLSDVKLKEVAMNIHTYFDDGHYERVVTNELETE